MIVSSFFLTSLLLSFGYVSQGRPGTIVFWSLTIAIVLSLLTEMHSSPLPSSKSFQILVLVQVVYLCLTLNSLYQWRGMGNVPGYDTQLDMGATFITRDFVWPTAVHSTYVSQFRSVYCYPILHILALAVSEIDGASLVSSALFLPSMIVSFTVLGLYAFARTFTHDARVALQSSLTFVFVMGVVSCDFVRQTAGIFFLVLSLWMATCVLTRKNAGKMSVSFLFVAVAFGLSHSFSAFAGIILLFSLALLFFLLKRHPLSGKFSYYPEATRVVAVLAMALLLVLVWLLLVVRLDISPLSTVLQYFLVASQEGFAKSGSSSIPWDVYASYLGNGILLLVANIGAFCALRKIGSTLAAAVTLLGCGWSFALVGGIFLLNRGGEVPISLVRALLFSWVVMIPVSLYSFRILLQRKGRAVRLLLPFFFVLTFAVLGILYIPTYIYDQRATPDYSSGDVDLFLTPEDFALATSFTLNGSIVGDQGMQELLAGYWGSDVKVSLAAFQGDTSVLRQYDWLVVRAEDFRIVWDRSAPRGSPLSEVLGHMPKEFFVYLAETTPYDVVYDSGSLWVFAV